MSATDPPSSPPPPRLLVLDAYHARGRAELREAGASEAWRLFHRGVLTHAPGATIDVRFPADGELELPAGVTLADYDGALWTGSSLTIYHHERDARVGRQVALARALLDAGVPNFGSCWAAQLAVVACGGACDASPKGREFGIVHDLELTEAGRAHPLFRGKPTRFMSFAIHFDEVVELAGARALASNSHSRVQAVAATRSGTQFWATQYHPEYDLHELARVTELRRDALLSEGQFDSEAEAARFVEALDALHRDPTDAARVQELAVDESLLDPQVRWIELRNWLEALVLPRTAARSLLALALAVATGACASAQEPPSAERVAVQDDAPAPPEDEASDDDDAALSGPRRTIPEAHRVCARDEDCVTLHADCSNVSCVGVHREHAARYEAPLDCSDYRGPVANYDCLPEFNSERPACQDGQCVSVKLARD